MDFDFDDEIIIEDDVNYNILTNDVLQNFPFLEDDIDAITDYELISKTYEYLDDKKANKEDVPKIDDYYNKDEVDNLLDEKANISDIPDVSNFITKDVDNLTNYYNKNTTDGLLSAKANVSDIPDVSDFITKDVNDLTYYTKSSDLSSVATSGNYNDLSNKPTIPTIPTNVSTFTNDAGYITKDVNDLTYYTLSSSLSSVATSGSYNDLSNKPTIIKATSLFTGDESSGPVSLSDSVSNYDFIDIVYRSADGTSFVGTQRIYNATNKNTFLEFKRYAGNRIYIKYIEISITTNQITLSNGYEYYFSTYATSSITSSPANYIYITDVIGYKS